MARDIEEFLRKAAERRQQQKQDGGDPQAQPSSREQPPLRASQQPPSSISDPIIHDVEIIEDQQRAKKKKSKKREESVSEHVERYLDTTGIRKKTQSLGSQVAQISQQFENTVHSNLDHDICSVDDDREASPGLQLGKAENSMATQLRRMLARPESIAQAFLISEVLNRPKFEDD